MSTFTLRYHPDSDLGKQYKQWRFGRFRSQLAAEDARRNCHNRESIEVVEVDE